jgi:ATP-dependent Lhr-like helicase
MMDPRRKSAAIAQTAATSLRKRAAARTTAGRWSLLCDPQSADTPSGPSQQAAIAAARLADAALDAHARILLCRYGVLFRDLLARESNAPRWRDLAPILRRLEARGEIRGGRFVNGPFGDQFALPETIESLRAARREAPARTAEPPIAVAAADPLNLAGILVPGDRIPAVPGRELQFQNGAVVEDTPATVENLTAPPKLKRTRSIADILRNEAVPARRAPASASLELFS